MRELVLIRRFDIDNIYKYRKLSFLNLASIGSAYDRKDDNEICYGIDGYLLALLVSMITRSKIHRVSFDFTSIAGDVFDCCVRDKKKVFFVGAKDKEVNLFKEKIEKLYPGLDVAGVSSGYIERDKWSDVISNIELHNSDIIVVGMGAGIQEDFISRIDNPHITAFSCGGFIRQESNSAGNYYPSWIDSLGLRSFYRMYKEPHTIKRYFVDYPLNSILLVYMFVSKKIIIKVV